MKSKAVALTAALACSSLAHAQQGMRQGEWRYWGGDAGSTRYSALDQINATNARNLQLAWRWQALPGEGAPDSNFKATPLMIDGVLYTSAGVHQAAAIDPRTGTTLWVFTPDPREIAGRGGVPPSGRGVAYWSDGREKRVFLNTLDGRLISIDARTGRADPKFGANGTVLLKEQLTDRPVPMVGSSSPPIVVGNVVVVQTVSEVAATNKEAIPGHIRGYDVRTGKRLWIFHTIPQRGEPGVETWEQDSWAYTGNAGVWTMMSADPGLGYVYLPVETPSHDFYGGHRLGNNLYAESIVCLNAKTGKRVWHFQIVHHGVWDYDPPAAPILGDIEVDGRKIRAVTLLTKQAMSFVFDRRTGKPVWPIEERPVPASDVPGERLSPTQPFPTKPLPYERLGYNEEDLIDFTPFLRTEALDIAQQYVRGAMYTPITRVIEGGTKGTFLGESGSLNGDPGGRMFRAYDKASGAVVAEIELPSKTTGAPMTYMYEGKQYIVVAVSTREHPAELVALSLPDSTKSQPAAPTEVSAPSTAAPPVAPADTPGIRNGRQIFATSCAICHGRGGEGVAGGPPSLSSVRDVAKVRQMVTKGGVQMPAMQAVLTQAQIHDVSEYVAAGLPSEPKQP